jgi:hypothetical protein
MAYNTLTYSDSVDGWVSFYSYEPDFMVGMNNYFYTFRGGNIYRHSVNSLRNNFYGVQYDSYIKSVFNDVPLENKLFKTLNLEGDDAWEATMITDLQFTGFIQAAWFERKEAAWFAFVRNSGTIPADPQEYPLRSLNGIGRSITVTIVGTTTTIDFSVNPLVLIDSILSIGDILYFALPPSTALQLAGQVTAVNRDYPQGINQIVIDTSITGTVPIPTQNPYLLYIKNSIAESHGVLGHYCVFTLENSSTAKTELFMAETEVMKSYP